MQLIGQKFTRLTVVALAGQSRYGKVWLCICDCGKAKEVITALLNSKRIQSCGCLHNEGNNKYHGHATGGFTSPTYNSWFAMIQRCNNSKDQSYEDYGGRGIKVCERWLKFPNFLADMGARPIGKTIDRIDNNGNYEKDNCQWSDAITQASNRRKRKVHLANKL